MIRVTIGAPAGQVQLGYKLLRMNGCFVLGAESCDVQDCVFAVGLHPAEDPDCAVADSLSDSISLDMKGGAFDDCWLEDFTKEVFKCQQCDAEFDNHRSLNGHMNKHRKDPREQDQRKPNRPSR